MLSDRGGAEDEGSVDGYSDDGGLSHYYDEPELNDESHLRQYKDVEYGPPEVVLDDISSAEGGDGHGGGNGLGPASAPSERQGQECREVHVASGSHSKSEAGDAAAGLGSGALAAATTPALAAGGARPSWRPSQGEGEAATMGKAWPGAAAAGLLSGLPPRPGAAAAAHQQPGSPCQDAGSSSSPTASPMAADSVQSSPSLSPSPSSQPAKHGQAARPSWSGEGHQEVASGAGATSSPLPHREAESPALYPSSPPSAVAAAAAGLSTLGAEGPSRGGLRQEGGVRRVRSTVRFADEDEVFQ